MENEKDERNGKKIFLLVLKILWTVTYFAVTAFLLVWYIDLWLIEDKDFFTAAALIIVSLVFFGISVIGYILAEIFGVIGLVTAMTNSGPKSDKIFFTVATVLPVVTGIVWIVVWTCL